MGMDLYETLLEYGPLRGVLNQQAQAQQYYDNSKHLAEYERHRWRASVSQHWLNTMLDQEIGI